MNSENPKLTLAAKGSNCRYANLIYQFKTLTILFSPKDDSWQSGNGRLTFKILQFYVANCIFRLTKWLGSISALISLPAIMRYLMSASDELWNAH